ncbi:MAG: NADP-dependent phosphogluconate dehydrogenase [Polyangiaceae bacterium]|nr:NADP-dependent phosphogluconate dehydrogenase [Polyangiaceae bacterium]
MTDTLGQFGMIGMAVMGRNLALNIADHGFRVVVWNLEPALTASAVAESGGRLIPTATLAELVQALERPRKIMMMIQAGKPVDIVLEQLKPLLSPGDIVIDGGNSLFDDTRRREAMYREAGLRFMGSGVSGGEDGARHGPSLMPGGDAEAYALVAPVFEAIAAKSDDGACVTHCGSDGAGHFIKMVHNGIEYADMQFIAEAYDLLRGVLGLTAVEIGDIFTEWNRGPLESFLIEISAKIFKVKDTKTNGALVDAVLDKAGQKGTGRWTAQVALELGVAIPSIAASIDARVLSSMKDERARASLVLAGPRRTNTLPKSEFISSVHDALYAAKIGAYAQGMALISAGAKKYGWAINLREIARIWKGGCIIRARFLDTIMKAYERNPELSNLLLDPQFSEWVTARQAPWRNVLSLALLNGVPVPGMASSLAYYDSYRTLDLPQNLTQAQRDAFGAHTYQRKDDPNGPFVHTEWLSD